jgi:hypothetical protein
MNFLQDTPDARQPDVAQAHRMLKERRAGREDGTGSEWLFASPRQQEPRLISTLPDESTSSWAGVSAPESSADEFDVVKVAYPAARAETPPSLPLLAEPILVSEAEADDEQSSAFEEVGLDIERRKKKEERQRGRVEQALRSR